MSSPRQCPDCGFSVAADAAHCSSCGRSMTAEESQPTAEPPAHASTTRQPAPPPTVRPPAAPSGDDGPFTEPAPEIGSYLGRSVMIAMVGLLCCGMMTAAMSSFWWLFVLGLPPAIASAVAIMHGIRVGDRETTGDEGGALESSESARKWNKAARNLMWPGLATLLVLFVIEGVRQFIFS